MEWVLLFSFLFTDIIMVGVCYAVYAHKDQYEQGMLWGVHIPREACEDKEVQAMVKKWKKAWNRFLWFHMPAGIAVCFLAFVSMAVFFIVWSVWLVFCIVDMMRLSIQPHREMYALKIERNWIQESKKQLVCADTRVSTQVQAMVPSAAWHLIGLGVILLTGLVCAPVRNYITHMTAAFFIMSLLISVMFGGLHFFVRRMHNSVYSQDTEVNLAVNQLYKYDWAVSTLLVSGGNVLAWLWLCLRIWISDEVSNADMMIYILIQLFVELAIFFPIVHYQKKKKEILHADQQPIYVDDDVYWKNGWYNNPNDHRLLVPNRLCDTNYSFNMARPAAKVWSVIIYGIAVASVMFLVYVMIPLLHIELEITQTGQQISIEEAGYEVSFSKDQIESVQLLDEMPKEHMIKKNGVATDTYEIGHYKGRTVGKCMLFLQEAYTPILQIELEDQFVFVNSKNEGEIEALYENLKK